MRQTIDIEKKLVLFSLNGERWLRSGDECYRAVKEQEQGFSGIPVSIEKFQFVQPPKLEVYKTAYPDSSRMAPDSGVMVPG